MFHDSHSCRMYIDCSKCESVVLPKLGDQIKGKEEIFCPRCDCKYENRNTTIIKVLIFLPNTDQIFHHCYVMYEINTFFIFLQIVVIIVIWVISLLVIYMLFLICLDPLLNKRIHKASANIGYHEHNNEEVNIKFLPSIYNESLWQILLFLQKKDKCSINYKFSSQSFSSFSTYFYLSDETLQFLDKILSSKIIQLLHRNFQFSIVWKVFQVLRAPHDSNFFSILIVSIIISYHERKLDGELYEDSDKILF